MNIAFDFDGVLVDSFEPLYCINVDGARKVGRAITRAQYREAFNGPVHQELKRILGLSPEEDEAFRAEKKRIFPDYYNADTVTIYPWAKEAIPVLAKAHSLYIVTAAPAQFVTTLLRKENLEDHFEGLFGSHPNGKQDTLSYLFPLGGVFVTDTVGDIKETKETKGAPIGVEWGFHDYDSLFEAGAYEVFTNPEALVRFLSACP
jgi:phosphoglycolate phosphatase-like HAD superfamily hydrolase